MFNTGGYSLADVAAATGNNRNGYNDGFGNGSWWIIVLFLFAFMNNGFGRNNNGYNDAMLSGVLTRADLCQDMNFQELSNAVRGVQSGLCDGFYAQLANYTAMQRQLCDEFNNTNQNIQQARFDQKDCCCQTQRAIDALGFQSAQETCRLENAIREQGESIKALITQNTIQDLRDKVEDKDRDLLAARFQISQIGQTANLIDQIRPCPIPAYSACSPYVANTCNGGFGNCCNG